MNHVALLPQFIKLIPIVAPRLPLSGVANATPHWHMLTIQVANV